MNRNEALEILVNTYIDSIRQLRETNGACAQVAGFDGVMLTWEVREPNPKWRLWPLTMLEIRAGDELMRDPPTYLAEIRPQEDTYRYDTPLKEVVYCFAQKSSGLLSDVQSGRPIIAQPMPADKEMVVLVKPRGLGDGHPIDYGSVQFNAVSYHAGPDGTVSKHWKEHYHNNHLVKSDFVLWITGNMDKSLLDSGLWGADGNYSKPLSPREGIKGY